MQRNENIVRYSLKEIKEKLAAGEDRTNWTKVDALTEEKLEAAIASDPDWKNIPADWWKEAQVIIPANKKSTTIRVDADVLEWFKQQGKGWQTQMNAVLRTYYKAHHS